MSDEQTIEQLLSEERIYMVLSIVLEDGTPWAVPVRLREHDGIKSFEWDSHLSTEHSKAILQRSVMSITIFQKKEASQIGFYAKGKAELIEEYKPSLGRYRFITEQAWINDETFIKREVRL